MIIDISLLGSAGRIGGYRCNGSHGSHGSHRFNRSTGGCRFPGAHRFDWSVWSYRSHRPYRLPRHPGRHRSDRSSGITRPK